MGGGWLADEVRVVQVDQAEAAVAGGGGGGFGGGGGGNGRYNLTFSVNFQNILNHQPE